MSVLQDQELLIGAAENFIYITFRKALENDACGSTLGMTTGITDQPLINDSLGIRGGDYGFRLVEAVPSPATLQTAAVRRAFWCNFRCSKSPIPLISRNFLAKPAVADVNHQQQQQQQQ